MHEITQGAKNKAVTTPKSLKKMYKYLIVTVLFEGKKKHLTYFFLSESWMTLPKFHVWRIIADNNFRL